MATISFNFRPSKKQGINEGSLFLRIIHDRKTREITTNYHVFPDEWDYEKKCIRIPETYSHRLEHLIETEDKMQDDMRKISTTVALLEEYGSFNIDDILRGFQVRPQTNMISAYTQRICSALNTNGQDRTARAYRSAVNRLIDFNKGQDLSIEEICSSLMRKFETYLKETGKSMNTISFYMRNIRSIYHRAIKERLIIPRYENPFTEVYTGLYPTRKRALSKQEMHQLTELEIAVYEPKKLFPFRKEINILKHEILKQKMSGEIKSALAMFMFCFHARGMSFIDMAFLKKRNIKSDEICYVRRKTKKTMRVKVTRPMKFIINFFEPMTKNSPYVFPLIVPGQGTERKQYENALSEQNKLLKEIGKMAGLEPGLSTHWARHSWATIARTEHIPLPVISEALGHRDEKTTTIYLDSFNKSVIDRVSDQISRVIR
jgi:site-specific recombinase XerD